MKQSIKFLSVISFLLVLAFSCKKDEKVDNQTNSALDNSIAQNLFQDIKKVVEEAANDEGASNINKKTGYSFGNCASVSVTPAWSDTATWPKVMTIDFGATNCVDNYGTNRRGKLIITLSDRYKNIGSVLSVVPENYHVNNYMVEGNKTLTNNGRNAANNLNWTVQVTNGKITYPDGRISTWQATRNNEWITGESTTLFSDGVSGICDDEYLVTGSSNGINTNGLAYTTNITSPLKAKVCCRWITSGNIEIYPQGLITRSIDFGIGNCDALATISIGGNSFLIPLN
ncbi:hypothetical protein FRY74_10555 [Vicingus serpentipes]|jgi:hypothetical protein|uniref:Lipoprotein n=1 Tax=Vicingus serpentipes TaxID=1926625 RepID=A0A5C6RQM8_9FLAO|nr:hypothetical protein [Vicingus serpentipes]TXB64225.1 hypothetical protein FRY74_10555 [Vicingus serpentipes]